MMSESSCQIRAFRFGAVTLEVLVPQIALRSEALSGGERPYWAKVWPSAIALCEVIAAQPEIVNGKSVLELGAGLGLPGLLAAHWAAEVLLSDYNPESVAALALNAGRNALDNVRCRQLDWNILPAELDADVLLLSDINYEPAAFDALFAVIRRYLSERTTVLLATPQRLLAKPFIERLLPYCAANTEIAIEDQHGLTMTNVLVLRSQPDKNLKEG